MWSFFFNISTTAKASNFKFGMLLEFAKAHHKIVPRGKRGGGLGLGEVRKILGFFYNISATAGASDCYVVKSSTEVAKGHDAMRRYSIR